MFVGKRNLAYVDKKNLQPWEYVYDLLMPVEEAGKHAKYIYYLALAVTPTKEFEKKIRRGDTEDLELPVYPVAFLTEPAKDKGDRIAAKNDFFTALKLYANDHDFARPIEDLEFKRASVPGYLPLAVLELHFEGNIPANPDDYGLKPIDGYKWKSAYNGGYKITGGLLFNIAKVSIAKSKNKGRYVVLFLDENPKEFNALNGYGVVRFDMSLKNAPPEVYTKAKEECESAGGIYRISPYAEYIVECTLPLNKEVNNKKASEFILQLNDMIKSKITSEDFLKHDMTVKLAGSERIPVKPVIGKIFQEMVKVAAKDLILGGEEKESKQESQGRLFNPFTIVKDLLLGEIGKEEEEEKETKQESQLLSSQKSQGRLFNPFTIVDEMLTEEQKQNETEEENNTVKLS
ncbi:MAG: hypothetical protein OWQ50_00600 [Acidianus infernus]|nr:hypothetical protein [Acidianus infernus]